MTAAESLLFRSHDGRFGLRVPREVVGRMLADCAASAPVETGGILVGRYSEDCRMAEVTGTSRGPSDRGGARASFLRGVKRLLAWLRELWVRRADYYLGEWHSHPGASPVPSRRDVKTMLDIAKSKPCNCPEAVLLVVGGGEHSQWTFHTKIFTRENSRALLEPCSIGRREQGDPR